MPSFRHEILVDLFRSRGEVAAELLRARGIELAHARVEAASIDLSQVVSTEYRADAVLVLRDAGDEVVAGVIVEVQLNADRAKHLSWPVYVATLRARLGCPALLLVVAPDDKVAAWARTPLALGNPGSYLRPTVVGFADVPWIRNRAEAQRLPELAVLSALAHPELDVARAAIDAISPLPEEQRALYFDLVLMALPDALRHVLEVQMLKGYEFQSEYMRRLQREAAAYVLEEARTQGTQDGLQRGLEQGREQGLEQGREQGLEQGREQGLEQGRERGREDGLRTAALALARIKLTPSEADEAALAAICDPRRLTELIEALGRAGTADEARAALVQATAG